MKSQKNYTPCENCQQDPPAGRPKYQTLRGHLISVFRSLSISVFFTALPPPAQHSAQNHENANHPPLSNYRTACGHRKTHSTRQCDKQRSISPVTSTTRTKPLAVPLSCMSKCLNVSKSLSTFTQKCKNCILTKEMFRFSSIGKT